MIHTVVLQRLAIADLQGYFDYAAQKSRPDALKWLSRFHAALQTLGQHPDRCRLAWEHGKVDVEVREFLFGKRPYVFRAIFTIDGPNVRILRIRRGQRRELTAQELRDALTDVN